MSQSTEQMDGCQGADHEAVFLADVVSTVAEADRLLDEGGSWMDLVAEYKICGERLLLHPYARSQMHCGLDADELDGGCQGVESSFRVEMIYGLAACTEQRQVCELIARANRGYVEVKKCADVIWWAGLMRATRDKARRVEQVKIIAKELTRRLVQWGWERSSPGILYWPDWKTGDNGMCSADGEVGSSCGVSQASWNGVVPEVGSPLNGNVEVEDLDDIVDSSESFGAVGDASVCEAGSVFGKGEL